MKRYLIPLFLIFIFFFSFTPNPAHAFWWMVYHKPAFEGKVIDAETKEPIEGAVVVAIYEKYPIISGPGGGSSSIMNIKEVLTNRNGEFYIPSYTTIIQPFSIEADANFIIFKPSYGSFPHWRVSPPKLVLTNEPGDSRYLTFEEFFSREVGTLKEFWASEPWKKEEKPPQKIKVAFGIVELPKLRTREERIKVSVSPVENSEHRSSWYYKKQKLFIKAIREEWQYLFGKDPSKLYRWEDD